MALKRTFAYNFRRTLSKLANNEINISRNWLHLKFSAKSLKEAFNESEKSDPLRFGGILFLASFNMFGHLRFSVKALREVFFIEVK